MAKDGLRFDGLPGLLNRLRYLEAQEILVGVPAEEAGRKEGPINNASLAYIHDHGSPINNLPARPFMAPGIKVAQDKISRFLGKAAEFALTGDKEKVTQNLHIAGLAAQNGIRSVINAGVDPSLSESTIEARQRRGRSGTVPLIDTGQLRNSITYVLKEKK